MNEQEELQFAAREFTELHIEIRHRKESVEKLFRSYFWLCSALYGGAFYFVQEDWGSSSSKGLLGLLQEYGDFLSVPCFFLTLTGFVMVLVIANLEIGTVARIRAINSIRGRFSHQMGGSISGLPISPHHPPYNVRRAPAIYAAMVVCVWPATAFSVGLKAPSIPDAVCIIGGLIFYTASVGCTALLLYFVARNYKAGIKESDKA